MISIPGLRVALERTPGVRARSPLVRSHADVAPLVARFIGRANDREHVVTAALDVYDHVIGLTLVAVGRGNVVQVHPADVYRPLILAACHRYYLAHNHPSGRLVPSPEDIELTRRLHGVGQALGIELCDHLILGREGEYRSLRECAEAAVAWHPAPNARWRAGSAR